MRDQTSLKNARFYLGAGQVFEISLSSKTGFPIAINQPFSTAAIDCKMYFRSGTQNWFGVDNQANHGQLHMHLASGTRTWKESINLPEQITLAQLISNVFEKAQEIVQWKFEGINVISGAGFVGCA
jgi:hypothetical protein